MQSNLYRFIQYSEDPTCELCNQPEEIFYVLLYCPLLAEVIGVKYKVLRDCIKTKYPDSMTTLAQRRISKVCYVGPTSIAYVGPTSFCSSGLRWANVLGQRRSKCTDNVDSTLIQRWAKVTFKWLNVS